MNKAVAKELCAINTLPCEMSIRFNIIHTISIKIGQRGSIMTETGRYSLDINPS